MEDNRYNSVHQIEMREIETCMRTSCRFSFNSSNFSFNLSAHLPRGSGSKYSRTFDFKCNINSQSNHYIHIEWPSSMTLLFTIRIYLPNKSSKNQHQRCWIVKLKSKRSIPQAFGHFSSTVFTLYSASALGSWHSVGLHSESCCSTTQLPLPTRLNSTHCPLNYFIRLDLPDFTFYILNSLDFKNHL